MSFRVGRLHPGKAEASTCAVSKSVHAPVFASSFPGIGGERLGLTGSALVIGVQQLGLHGRPDLLDELLLVQEAHLALGGVHVHVHVRTRQPQRLRAPSNRHSLEHVVDRNLTALAKTHPLAPRLSHPALAGATALGSTLRLHANGRSEKRISHTTECLKASRSRAR